MRLIRLVYGAFLRLFPFDANYYRLTYGDVTELSARSARAHWLTQGWRQLRFPSLTAVAFHARLRGISLARCDPVSYIVWNPQFVRQGVTTLEATLTRMASDREWARDSKPVSFPREFVTALESAESEDSWSYQRTTCRHGDRYRPRQALYRALSQPSNEQFVIDAHRFLLGAPPSMAQLQDWVATLDAGATWRPAVLALLLELGQFTPSTMTEQTTLADIMQARRDIETAALRNPTPPEMYDLMGISVISRAEWHARAASCRQKAHGAPTTHSLSITPPQGPPKISVVTSIYNSDAFLPRWIANISQLHDLEWCEFVIVVVDAGAKERELLDQLATQLPRAVVIHVTAPCTIYQAWNIAVSASTAPYITNMNVDDLRSPEALIVARKILDDYPWVDVVTTDVAIELEPTGSWRECEQIGAVARLPLTTMPVLQSRVNPPHNAPMWRRSLHDELGMFDERMTSSADFDFWLRCARAGKKFFASPRVTAAYFDNPTGVSTSRMGVAIAETLGILDDNRDALCTGPAPAFVGTCSAFDPVVNRAMRLERGFVAEMIRLRSELANRNP